MFLYQYGVTYLTYGFPFNALGIQTQVHMCGFYTCIQIHSRILCVIYPYTIYSTYVYKYYTKTNPFYFVMLNIILFTHIFMMSWKVSESSVRSTMYNTYSKHPRIYFCCWYLIKLCKLNSHTYNTTHLPTQLNWIEKLPTWRGEYLLLLLL